MISIAVFLGFWAESFRNQISDNKKVMQIKKAIANDLKKDLNNWMNIRIKQNLIY